MCSAEFNAASGFQKLPDNQEKFEFSLSMRFFHVKILPTISELLI
jgi:hypothetical protein